MKFLASPLLALALIVSGCTYGDRVSYETITRPPTNPEIIEVVESHNLSRPYKVIGMVSSESSYMQSALDRMKYEAADMGANALLDFSSSGNKSGMLYGSGGMMMGGSYNTGYCAKAIVWQ